MLDIFIGVDVQFVLLKKKKTHTNQLVEKTLPIYRLYLVFYHYFITSFTQNLFLIKELRNKNTSCMHFILLLWF